MSQGMDFGTSLRHLRQERNLPLREVADHVGLSITYLSKVERGEMPPLAEDKVLALAALFGQNPDFFLALAGRLPSDLPRIILEHPAEYTTILKAFRRLSKDQLNSFIAELREKVEQDWPRNTEKAVHASDYWLLFIDSTALRSVSANWGLRLQQETESTKGKKKRGGSYQSSRKARSETGDKSGVLSGKRN